MLHLINKIMRLSTISSLFEAVQLTIFNLSANPEHQQKMSVYGFDAQRLQQGTQLLEEARQQVELAPLETRPRDQTPQ